MKLFCGLHSSCLLLLAFAQKEKGWSHLLCLMMCAVCTAESQPAGHGVLPARRNRCLPARGEGDSSPGSTALLHGPTGLRSSTCAPWGPRDEDTQAAPHGKAQPRCPAQPSSLPFPRFAARTSHVRFWRLVFPIAALTAAAHSTRKKTFDKAQESVDFTRCL